MLTSDPRWGVAPPMPAWHRHDGGDQLYGIDAIARWLALPERMVRTMIGARRLPVTMEGRSHTARRTVLAHLIVALEAEGRPFGAIAPPPRNIGPDGALGLLAGFLAIGTSLGCSVSGVRHRRASLALPVFWIGSIPLTRASSLMRWRQGQGAATRADRRQFTVAANRRQAAGDGALVGAAAIAAYLGRTVRGTEQAIYQGRLPVSRLPGAIVGDPVALAPFIRNKEDRNGECR